MSTMERVRTDPRISRRRRAIERSRRRRYGIAAGCVAVVAAGIWIAFGSPLLKVRDVVVVGGAHVSGADVAAIAGLDDSDNLLLLSTAQVARKVEELPWVHSAKVNRKLPGTVRVRVVERRAAVTLDTDEGRWKLDRLGHVLESGSGSGLTVLTGVSAGAVEPGDRIDEPEIESALAAWRSLSPRIRKRIAVVLAPTPERITLSFADGTQVRYGAAESMKAKNEVLGVLLREMQARGERAGYIDVRVPTSPAVSPAAPAAEAVPTPSPSA